MKFNLFSSKSRVRQFCLTMLCLFLFQGVIAQNKMLVGTVVDELGETLIGVSVLNKTTGEGTITAIDGSFSLSGKQNDLIQFSYIGYASVDYVVKQEENIRVVLKEDTQNLEEVVVVGYSAQKKSSLTGAIAPVNMDDMEKRRVATVSQALQGQVAGVQITQSTGAPGDDISMLIRGEGTIGNNSPLYIIDGVPSRTMTFLNPSDISSITVLKDASAAAVYGSRASGGVVVITTKEGEVGKGHLELNYYYGIQKVANLPRMLNTQQYMDVQEIAWNNAGYEGSNPYTIDKKGQILPILIG